VAALPDEPQRRQFLPGRHPVLIEIVRLPAVDDCVRVGSSRQAPGRLTPYVAEDVVSSDSMRIVGASVDEMRGSPRTETVRRPALLADDERGTLDVGTTAELRSG
jgi:hypothetical protein